MGVVKSGEQPRVGVRLAIISVYRVATKKVVDTVLHVRWHNSYELQFCHILELDGQNQTPEYYQCDYPTKCDCLTKEIYPERVGSHILALAPTPLSSDAHSLCRQLIVRMHVGHAAAAGYLHNI
jgi:hypothetical protein